MNQKQLNKIGAYGFIATEEETKKIATLHFQSDRRVTLRHIYGVLYFMKQGYKYTVAVNRTLSLFPDVQDYSTISAKCTRDFAESVSNFKSWFKEGKMLQEIGRHFPLSDYDYKIFEALLSPKPAIKSYDKKYEDGKKPPPAYYEAVIRGRKSWY